MTTIEHQIAQLTRAVQELASQMSPWISTPEMCKRYDCTPKTLNAMERRGDIPWRVKGRWRRSEVIELLAGKPTGPAGLSPDHVADHKALMLAALMATDAKPAPGVYFLLSEAGQIVYVGQSSNVLNRMAAHKPKGFHAVKMIGVETYAERVSLELQFIRLFKPLHNIAGLQLMGMAND